jgi:N-acetylneuraminic acid mutarotase
LLILILLSACKPSDSELTPIYGKWNKIEIIGEKPSIRWGMSMTFCKDNEIVLFGGGYDSVFLGDLWKYNVINHEWYELILDPSPIELIKYGMSSNYLNGNGDKVVIFGGLHNNDFTILNETWEYDVDLEAWENISIIGESPSLRMHHKMKFIDNNKLILFGGYNNLENKSILNDTWEYNIIDKTWIEKGLYGKTSPVRINFGMEYSPDDNVVIIFGGWVDVFLDTNETWLYDVENDKWLEIEGEGEKPSPRSHIQLSYIGDHKLMTFGGESLSGDVTYPNDTWIFDVVNGKWQECTIISDEKPSSRAAYSMTSDRNNVYMFGGVNENGEANNELWEFTLVEENSEE